MLISFVTDMSSTDITVQDLVRLIPSDKDIFSWIDRSVLVRLIPSDRDTFSWIDRSVLTF
jgi:hypothetical protein